MIKFILSLLFLSCSLFAQTLNIAVAANVSYAMDELKEEFMKTHPHISIRLILGSSGKLRAQIKHGAPYGVFMSANMSYPQSLFEDGLALAKPEVYAKGSLAFFSLKPRAFAKGIFLLEDTKIHKIALANPKTAPYGKAAMQAIQKAGLYEKLESKFVYAESISQTLSYALTAVEIGIVAKSSLYSSKMQAYKEDVNWKEVDSSLYKAIKQGVVLLKYAKGSKGYKDFYDFILSEPAQNIFKKYGYTL